MLKLICYTTISLFLFGCGSDEFTTAPSDFDGYGGENAAGKNSGDETGGSAETGGSGSETGGTETGGTSSGSGGTGSGGVDPGCVPETCEEIGERISGIPGHSACGASVDRCGNSVNCPISCGNYQTCGGHIWDPDSEGVEILSTIGIATSHFKNEQYPNVCGEDCVITTPDFSPCNSSYPNSLICGDGIIPDFQYCNAGSDSFFCCNTFISYGPAPL